MENISEKYKEELMRYYQIQKEKQSAGSTSSTETLPQNNTAESENKEIIPENNTESGIIRVEVTSANRAIPVEDAIVIITRKSNKGNELISVMLTDNSGSTPNISIPAPAASISEKVSEEKPYSLININIYKEGYYEVKSQNIQIFSGITSIQPVNLIPLPTNSENISISYKDEFSAQNL